VKVAGQWRHVYRAIDQFGQALDVFVAARRDASAAHRFFERAIGRPRSTWYGRWRVGWPPGARLPRLASR
jgi:hypothetical protein